MKGVDFFNSLDHLEPKCPRCDSVIKFGENTSWSDEVEGHVCNNCGTKVE